MNCLSSVEMSHLLATLTSLLGVEVAPHDMEMESVAMGMDTLSHHAHCQASQMMNCGIIM